jgi:predicted ATP-dependent protease
VLIPHQNERDLDDVPEEVRNAVSFHPVKTMDEVLELALERREGAGKRGGAGEVALEPAGDFDPPPPSAHITH